MKKDIFSNYELLNDIAKWLIIGGAVLILLYLGILGYNGFINPSGKIDPEVVGQFGDFVGGVVGSIWTLATILILISTFNLQRMENHNMSVDRLLDRVLKHSDSINRQIELIKLEINGRVLVGLEAINYLVACRIHYDQLRDSSKESYLNDLDKLYGNSLFSQLLVQLKNSNIFVHSKLKSRGISTEERRDIRDLYMNSMPFVLLESIGEALIYYRSREEKKGIVDRVKGHIWREGSRFDYFEKEETNRYKETFRQIDESFLRIRDVL